MTRAPLLLATGAMVLWGSLATVGTLLRGVPPLMLVGASLVVGGLLGLPGWRHWRVPFPTLLLGLYGIFLYHFCLFMAFRLAPPVEANLVNYLWPLLIVLLSPVVTGKGRLRWNHVVGGLLGFLGAALVVSGGQHVSFESSSWKGYLLALAAAFIWSTYSLLCQRVPPFPSSAVGLFCLVSGVMALAGHALLEEPYTPSAMEWALVAVLGLGPMGGAFYLWDAALKTGDARSIGSLSYVTPLLSTGLLALAGQGTLGGPTLVALLLIGGGAVLGTRRESTA